MGAVITEQAEPAGSAIGGPVGGRCCGIGAGGGGGGSSGPGGGGEAGRGVMGDGILECYEGLGLGLRYGHVFVGGGGGGRGSGRHSQRQRQNLRRHCGMYDENKD